MANTAEELDVEFEKAFTEFALGEVPKAEEPIEEEKAEEPVEEKAEEPVEEEKVEEPTEEATVEEEVVVEEKVIEPSQEVLDLQKTVAEMQEKLDAPVEPKVKEEVEEAQTLTAEEEAARQEFISQYPEQTAGVNAMFKQNAAETKRLVDEALTKLREEMKPTVEATATNTQNTYVATVTAAHSDAEELYSSGKLTAWVSKQKGILKGTFTRVLESSTADEMVELIDYYRIDNPLPSEKPVEKGKTVEQLAEDVQKKKDEADELARQTHVSTSRSQHDEPADPNDFDGAFKEFAGSP